MSLSLHNISIYRADSRADHLLQNFSLTVKRQEIVTLMGPSGCGKSTLLSLIAGHLSADFDFTGTVSLQGKEIQSQSPHARQVGLLFQEDMLFPHLNIWENIAFALPNSTKGKARQQAALELLDNVGLTSLAHVMPEQISGGQRARISLLRMLSAKPKVALLDEPFSKLDPELRITFREWVFEQLITANIPTLMVTHDLDDAPHNGTLIHWQQINKRPNYA